MIHARRQESGISRSTASRSDRLYRVSCLLVHFLLPFQLNSASPYAGSLLRPATFSCLASDEERSRTVGGVTYTLASSVSL